MAVAIQFIGLVVMNEFHKKEIFAAYDTVFGIILIITLALWIFVALIRTDSVRSLLKPESQLNLYELQLAAYISGTIAIRSRLTEIALKEKIKEMKFELRNNFTTLHIEFCNQMSLTDGQSVSTREIIKKAIWDNLHPADSTLTHFQILKSEPDQIIDLPFITYDRKTHDFHYQFFKQIFTKNQLEVKVSRGEFISLENQPIPIRKRDRLVLNPDGKIFLMNSKFVKKLLI